MPGPGAVVRPGIGNTPTPPRGANPGGTAAPRPSVPAPAPALPNPVAARPPVAPTTTAPSRPAGADAPGAPGGRAGADAPGAPGGRAGADAPAVPPRTLAGRAGAAATTMGRNAALALGITAATGGFSPGGMFGSAMEAAGQVATAAIVTEAIREVLDTIIESLGAGFDNLIENPIALGAVVGVVALVLLK